MLNESELHCSSGGCKLHQPLSVKIKLPVKYEQTTLGKTTAIEHKQVLLHRAATCVDARDRWFMQSAQTRMQHMRNLCIEVLAIKACSTYFVLRFGVPIVRRTWAAAMLVPQMGTVIN